MTNALQIPDPILRAALAKVIGEEAVLVSDVDWDLKNPCDDCPFLKASPFHEGVAENLVQTTEAIMAHRFTHTCHKTDSRPSVDGPRTWPGKVKHCAGALLMLLKTGNGLDLQLPLLQAIEAGKFDIKEMTARAKADRSVFTVPGLLKFYANGMARRARRRKARERRLLNKAERRRRKR